MLVFGDHARRVRARDVAADLADRLAALDGIEGADRHAALASAFILAGAFVQGVDDEEAARRGVDDLSARGLAGARLLHRLASALGRSFEGIRHDPPDCAALLAELGTDAALTLKQPEGYAFYALYPEGYWQAARQSGLGRDTVVIGIRSIGTGLAAMVAAALDADPAVTVRPGGDPYARTVSIGPALARHLLATPSAAVAIVDEGPGQSGSSFGSVLDWLEAHGVARDRCHVFPSHAGDLGPRASEAHRERWRQLPRHTVGFDALLVDNGVLARAVETQLGPLSAPLEDIAGGRWRQLSGSDAPVDARFERRKFIATTDSGRFLVKFAGLGAAGEHKLALAHRLAVAGLSAPPVGLAQGFLIAPWRDGAPVETIPRSALLAPLADYLACRARLPAPTPGASLLELRRMALRNTELQLGSGAAEGLSRHLGDSSGLNTVPVITDNRMHRWEWRVAPGGTLFKTDALDHHASHDLVGCQDIAWDIVGAEVELGLSPDERDRLAADVGRQCGRSVDPQLLAFLEPCYLAFQIGLWTFAAEAAPAGDRERIDALLAGYAERLSALIART